MNKRNSNGNDTVMFLRSALSGLVEDGDVNAKDFKDWLVNIDRKLDINLKECGACRERIAKVEEKASAAHRRLDEQGQTLRDEVNSAKGAGKPAWLAIILSFITATGGAIAAYFLGRSK